MKLATRVGLAACVALGAIVPASANHSWSNYRWGRTSNPVQLRINSAVTGTWSTYVNIAINEWDASSKLDLKTFAPRSVSVSRKQCSPIPNEVLVCNDSYGKRGWLGIASVWLSGGRIAQATTKLNDSYFSMPQYSSQGWRRLVTCQEIGHDFGLAHQDENFTNPNLGSCMDYTNFPDNPGTGGEPNNWSPDSHDMAQLDTIYGGALDGTSTDTRVVSTNFGVREVGKPAASPRSLPREGAGDTAAEWGGAVHRDGQGRPDQFVRRFSDGTIMITHVLWTPGAKGTEAGPVHEGDGHTH